ncbi:MAG: Dabb family protein [Sphingobacterium sp.]|uniref:Dabb family protein n=1 Tax=Sphingobacterium sp. JB170 TaxID=1434842 RepID=UPI00097F1A36|nr:Dabb family protein [Sphingobacterium sp. JB170]SJN40133.1 hypothetical protein FM107_10455 [Sphingobacterium sp. JB170]
MERRSFLQSAATLGVSAALTGSCSSAASGQAADVEFDSGRILHTVYFWLKEGITEQEEQDFLEFFAALQKIPGILAFHIGKPAPTTDREVVDNSFQYSIFVLFNSIEEINVYEKHPDHLAAAEKYSKYWTKVAVRDTQFV